MDLIRIVKESWATLRDNRSLWFFGFFVAGAGGTGARYSHHAGGGPMPSWLLPVLVGAGVLGATALVLNVVSESALIDGVRRTRRGERYGVGQGMRAGLKYFWRIVGIKLAALSAVLLTTAIAAVPIAAVLLAGGPAWAGALGTLPLALVLVPWLVSVYFLYEYALRVAVVEDRGVRDSARAALEFLQGRLALSLQIVVASGLGQVVAGLAGLVCALPVALLGGAAYLAGGLPAALVTFGALMVPIAACLGGALGTYRSSLWTHGYLDARALVG